MKKKSQITANCEMRSVLYFFPRFLGAGLEAGLGAAAGAFGFGGGGLLVVTGGPDSPSGLEVMTSSGATGPDLRHMEPSDPNSISILQSVALEQPCSEVQIVGLIYVVGTGSRISEMQDGCFCSKKSPASIRGMTTSGCERRVCVCHQHIFFYPPRQRAVL